MMEITAYGYKHTDNIVRPPNNDERNYENNEMHIRPPRIPTLKTTMKQQGELLKWFGDQFDVIQPMFAKKLSLQ